MRPDWHEYFMMVAKMISTRSTCNSRPTGAILVKDRQILSTGYNGAMPGVDHCVDQPDLNGKPYCFRRAINAPEADKYNYCKASHAEANAVARAAKYNIQLDGSTLYVTLAPCYVCLKLLATAGVKNIYYEYLYESTDKVRDEHWVKVIEESPIETFEELKVSQSALDFTKKSLEYPTSKRRLVEKL
jgi:dCMP deaminase